MTEPALDHIGNEELENLSLAVFSGQILTAADQERLVGEVVRQNEVVRWLATALQTLVAEAEQQDARQNLLAYNLASHIATLEEQLTKAGLQPANWSPHHQEEK